MPLPSSKREVQVQGFPGSNPRVNAALLVWVTIVLLAASVFG
jgi:hypothetical protein